MPISKACLIIRLRLVVSVSCSTASVSLSNSLRPAIDAVAAFASEKGGIGFRHHRTISDQADAVPQMIACLSSAAVLGKGPLSGERRCCKQLRKSDAFNSF